MRHVSVSVPHVASRDHLGEPREESGRADICDAKTFSNDLPALERTYLSYLRTSLAFAQLGVIVAQLFRVQHAPSPSDQLGFFLLGKPLAGTCYGIAIFIALNGFARFWKQQNAMVQGKIWAGGWEAVILWIIVLIVRRNQMNSQAHGLTSSIA